MRNYIILSLIIIIDSSLRTFNINSKNTILHDLKISLFPKLWVLSYLLILFYLPHKSINNSNKTLVIQYHRTFCYFLLQGHPLLVHRNIWNVVDLVVYYLLLGQLSFIYSDIAVWCGHAQEVSFWIK